MAQVDTSAQADVADEAATVTQLPARGMITIKGDLASRALKRAVTAAVGLTCPAENSAIFEGDKAVLWMAPDEALLLCPRDAVSEALTAVATSLADSHALAVDVSDARCVFAIEGQDAQARETLAKLSPADLHPDACPPGCVRRTRLAQVPAAIWFEAPGQARVIAFRSVSDYVLGLLTTAANGRKVGHF